MFRHELDVFRCVFLPLHDGCPYQNNFACCKFPVSAETDEGQPFIYDFFAKARGAKTISPQRQRVQKGANSRRFGGEVPRPVLDTRAVQAFRRRSKRGTGQISKVSLQVLETLDATRILALIYRSHEPDGPTRPAREGLFEG